MENEQNIDTEELLQKCELDILSRKEAIKQEFSKNKKIIDLNACQLDDIDASTISICLKAVSISIEVFQISYNNITDIGLIDILSNLHWCINLKELYFGNNENLTEVGMNALIEVLPIFKKLRILGLNNCGIVDENVILLSYSLESLTALEMLFLNNNYITDNGLICLSLALNKLRVLYLGANKFTEFGFKTFFECLKTNTSLCCLTLNDMEMNSNIISDLNTFLIKNQTLEDLNLSNAQISNSDIKILKNGLNLNSSLKVLHLNGNEITDDGAWEIFIILKDYNESLTSINLFGNEIDENIIEEIQDLLKQNRMFQRHIQIKKKKDPEEIHEDLQEIEEEKDDEKEMELYESLIEEQRKEITQQFEEVLKNNKLAQNI